MARKRKKFKISRWQLNAARLKLLSSDCCSEKEKLFFIVGMMWAEKSGRGKRREIFTVHFE
jgi:hypothetical protein